MDTLLNKLGSKVKGVLEGFDRIVFKGHLKPLCHEVGMQIFLKRIGVLNKNYSEWLNTTSATIVREAEEYSLNRSGTKTQYLNSPNIRKDTLVRDQQLLLGIESGLIGTWSCLESCNTYKAGFNEVEAYPKIRYERSKCKHLYFYYDHEDLGFMSIRLQTWAPYSIQIALNGRQWLRRMLDKSNSKYILEGNKFFDIEDYELAQKLFNLQLDTRWIDTFNGFLPDVFPSMRNIIGDDFGYNWILWQSEWAKDYIFHDPKVLSDYMKPLLRHAFISGTSDRIIQYFGHPILPSGQPYSNAKPEVITRLSNWYDGARIRHWHDNNSLKIYNEQNILRFEFTMNNPARYRIYRTAEGDSDGEKKLRHMRKGISDIVPRTMKSSHGIKNLTEQVACLEDDSTVGDILSKVSIRKKINAKSYRALDVTGKDLELLKAISDPIFFVEPITNKYLQKALGDSSWAKGFSGSKLSARISRHLRLLRVHGIIKKLPNQHKYVLTHKGRSLTSALSQFLAAKLSDLASLAA